MSKAKLDEKGYEICDPATTVCPVHFKRPLTLEEKMRNIIRSEELRKAADQCGMETFEESDDFDCGDTDPHSPYEEVFDPGAGQPPSQPVFQSEEPVMQVKEESPKPEKKAPAKKASPAKKLEAEEAE